MTVMEKTQLVDVLNAAREGRPLPWSGVGVDVSGATSVDEALHRAGLDWTVEHRPLLTVSGSGQAIEVPDSRAVVRVSDDRPLGPVGMVHTLVQNAEGFAPAQVLLEDGHMQLLHTGDVQHGRSVFLVGRMTKPIFIADERIDGFFFLRNGHDGRSGLSGAIANVRIHCTNQLPGLFSGGMAGKGIWSLKLRHTRTVNERIKVAQSLLSAAVRNRKAVKEEGERLVSRPFTMDDFTGLVSALYPTEGTKITPKAAASNEERQDQLRAIWLHSENLENVRGTAWGALNAVTEYADHAFPFRQTRRTPLEESRLLSIMDSTGAAQQLKNRAYRLITEALA